MERARKKTIKQAAGDAPAVEPISTESSPPVTPRRKSAAAKKVAEPKMVEAFEPSAVEAAEPETTPVEAKSPPAPKSMPKGTPKTTRRGRPAKSAVQSAASAAPDEPASDAAPKMPTPAPRARRSAQAKPAEAKAVKATVPKAKTSTAKTPTVKTPTVKTPTVKTPTAKTPKPAVAKAKAPAAKVAAPKPTKTKPASQATMAKPAPSKGVVPLEAGAEIKLGFLAGSVGFHLRLAQDASYRAFARHRDKDLIKPGRLPALAIIHLNPGISQSALGRAIARDKSTVSPLIKDLQKNGFISRKASTADRRSVTLALTKKGERTLERLQARAQEHEDEVDKIIGTSKSRLLSILDKITTGLAA